jgi:hypothetical protein
MQNDSNDSMTEIFGAPIYTYSRKQAVADGFQVEVSSVAREAGITFAVFLTRTVWDLHVKVPDGVQAQDETGRLWDIVWMLRYGIMKSQPGAQQILFRLHVRNTNRGPKLIELKAKVGPVDIDNPSAAITVMLPEED